MKVNIKVEILDTNDEELTHRATITCQHPIAETIILDLVEPNKTIPEITDIIITHLNSKLQPETCH